MMTPPPTTNRPADIFPANLLRAGVFLIAGVLGLPVIAGFVAAAAPKLAVLQHRSMPALAANHLVTLGWGTMIAFGSLHQLLPAAAGVRREVSRIVPIHFAVHLSGVVLFAAGFLVKSVDLLVAGGSVVVVSILIMLGVAASTLRRRTRWLPSLTYVVAALTCLGLVVAWGLLLVLNWKFVFWRALLMPMGLGVHLALGLIGWFVFLVVGVSYYLLPRFTAMKDPGGAHAQAVFAGLAAGLGLLLVGLLTTPGLVRAGVLLIGATGLLYTADLVRFIQAWTKQSRDLTRAHWQVIMAETAVLGAGAAAWALGLLPGEGLRWGVAGVTLFLLGWVTLAIAGQAYKVTPFLMWYYRFHLGLSALEVPRLDAPYWPPAGVPPFVLLSTAAPLMSLGVLMASPAVCIAGGIAFFSGALLFSFLLGYSWLPALLGGRRPKPPAEAR